MSDNRNRIILAPLRSTLWGKLALAGSLPLPPRYEPIADLVGERRSGVVLRHAVTGLCVLWIGEGGVQSLPSHKVAAALAAMGRVP